MPLRKNTTITTNAAILAAVLLAFGAQGCAQPAAPKDTRAGDEATIRAYSAAASEAAHAKDVDKEISFYADDALGFSNYSPTTTTKEAMRADMQSSFPAPGTIRWKTSVVEVARSGDLAYEHGRYTYTTPEKDGKNKTQTGNYLLVWRKRPGGDWKIAVDTDTADPPPAPPPPATQ
ncbi:MAG: nuclear transport factor 2 family protein [Candidatus Acidiferrales bacterium]